MNTAHITEPILKEGEGSFHGVIDTYFNAEVEIGNYTSIAPPLYVHGTTEHPCVFNRKFVSTFPFGDKWEVNYPKSSSKGKIIIGSDVWIGESVTLLSGVEIGDGAIVGARSVVGRKVEPYSIVVGNPARLVRFRFDERTINLLLIIKWWEWPKEKIEENVELLKDVDKFIEKYG